MSSSSPRRSIWVTALLVVWGSFLAVLIFLATALSAVYLRARGPTPPVTEIRPPAGFLAHGDAFCPGTEDGCSSTFEWFIPIAPSAQQLSVGQVEAHLRTLRWTQSLDGRWRRPPDWLGHVVVEVGSPSPNAGFSSSDPPPNDAVLIQMTYADGGRSRKATYVAIVWAVTMIPVAPTTWFLARSRRRRGLPVLC
jgi:hypothetical protein